MAFPIEGSQYDNRIYRNGVYRYTSELAVGELTVTGNHTLGVEKTVNVDVGTATITVPELELGEMKVIRKISATVGTITINLPATHTFPNSSSSITLTSQYEEVTIERVSATGWVEKDRVEVFQITSFLNGWAPLSSEWNVFVYKQGKVVFIRGLIVGGSQGSNAFVLPERFRPSRMQIAGVGGAQSSPDTYKNGIILIETNGILHPYYNDPSDINAYISLFCSFRVD